MEIEEENESYGHHHHFAESLSLSQIELFKTYMDRECHDLYYEEHRPNIPGLLKAVTKKMWTEFSKEFRYFYGKPWKTNMEIGNISFGYTDRWVSYFHQCLRYFAKFPNEKLRLDIIRGYEIVFGRKSRYWASEDLDNLEKYIDTIQSIQLN